MGGSSFPRGAHFLVRLLAQRGREPRRLWRLMAHQSPSPSTVPMAVPKAIEVSSTSLFARKTKLYRASRVVSQKSGSWLASRQAQPTHSPRKQICVGVGSRIQELVHRGRSSRLLLSSFLVYPFVHLRVLGLGPGPVCTASTTVLAEGAAKVANVLNVYVRPKITPVPGTSYIIAETHQNIRRRHRARLHNLSCLKNRLNPFLREARLNRYMAA